MPLTTSSNALPDRYDYIITGAGCAGLSLAMHLVQSGKFRDKKILLVDKDAKARNDRTWCFWEQDPGLFESIVKKEWRQLWFHAEGFSKKLTLEPYQYKLIRGLDFYQYCLAQLTLQPNFFFLQATVETAFSDATATGVKAGGKTYAAQYVFNSILFQKPILKPKQYWLLQHFKGWLVETGTPQFDAATGTLMDFRTDQKEGTTFFYVLPLSPTQALIEYTLFSKKLLHDAAYDTALKTYVEQQLRLQNYSIAETEFGVIPMSNYNFPTRANNLIYIGTAGGQTKASSGYTFRFIQKNAKAIVDQLLTPAPDFSKPHAKKRFQFYDSVLLHILQHDTLRGAAIFRDFFKNNDPKQVLKFLDDETTLPEELRLISSLPTWPFLKAAIRQIT